MGKQGKYKFAKKGCGYDTLYPSFGFRYFYHTSYFTELNAKESLCSNSFFEELEVINNEQ